MVQVQLLYIKIFFKVIASSLLYSRANSCLMEQDFSLKHNILLKKILCLTLLTIIDDLPIAFEDIPQELDGIRGVLGDLAYVINFNIIHSLKHLVIIGLPDFELHNPNIDWINQVSRAPQKPHV